MCSFVDIIIIIVIIIVIVIVIIIIIMAWVIVVFHGLPTGGLPTSDLVVVKINTGGLPISSSRCRYFGGLVTLWVAELAVVVVFSGWVSRGSAGNDVSTVPFGIHERGAWGRCCHLVRRPGDGAR